MGKGGRGSPGREHLHQGQGDGYAPVRVVSLLDFLDGQALSLGLAAKLGRCKGQQQCDLRLRAGLSRPKEVASSQVINRVVHSVVHRVGVGVQSVVMASDKVKVSNQLKSQALHPMWRARVPVSGSMMGPDSMAALSHEGHWFGLRLMARLSW